MKFLSMIVFLLLFNLTLAIFADFSLIPSGGVIDESVSIQSSEAFVSNGELSYYNNDDSVIGKIEHFNKDKSYIKRGADSGSTFTSINDFITAVGFTLDVFSKGTIFLSGTYKSLFGSASNYVKIDLSSSSDPVNTCLDSYHGSYIPSTGLCYYIDRSKDSLLKFIVIPMQLLYIIAFVQLLSGRNYGSLK